VRPPWLQEPPDATAGVPREMRFSMRRISVSESRLGISDSLFATIEKIGLMQYRINCEKLLSSRIPVGATQAPLNIRRDH
jgi:hypothetical protein